MTSGTLLIAQSAPVTQAPLRMLMVGAVIAGIVLVLIAMRRGWLHRARRQQDIPEPPEPPTGWAGSPAIAGLFLGSTAAGDWLDRIVVHDLGVRSRADLEVGDQGVLLRRTGARDVFIPRTDLRGARSERGIAGKAYARDGVVVLTWDLGGRLIDTGFRADVGVDQPVVLERVQDLLADERTA